MNIEDVEQSLKVSIITVCFNSEKTIEATIKSVRRQTYKNIEYIVIDGLSSDSTNQIIEDSRDVVSIHISEKDNGLYDAMNKGINLATGDIIGTLNSDDVLASDTIISEMVNNFIDCDGVYGDVGFYDSSLKTKKRHYSSKDLSLDSFSKGMMPAHPSLYIRKEIYKKVGEYRVDFKIASDFDMALRMFLTPNTKYKYLDKEFVKMRMGGISTSGIRSNLILNKEVYRSCRENGIKVSWFSILSKYPAKILGLLNK